jgi:hypothetical protein
MVRHCRPLSLLVHLLLLVDVIDVIAADIADVYFV